MSPNVATALSLMALLFLYWLVTGPITTLAQDAFRSKIRSLRDGLFDFMWKNGYDFDTPAYRAMRELLNDVLRASNLISFPLLVMAFSRKNEPADKEDGLTEMVNSVQDEKLRAELHRVASQTELDIAFHIFFRTGMGLFAVAFLTTFLALWGLWRLACHGGKMLRFDAFARRVAPPVIRSVRWTNQSESGRKLLVHQ